jgi:hypothetical protein
MWRYDNLFPMLAKRIPFMINKIGSEIDELQIANRKDLAKILFGLGDKILLFALTNS